MNEKDKRPDGKMSRRGFMIGTAGLMAMPLPAMSHSAAMPVVPKTMPLQTTNPSAFLALKEYFGEITWSLHEIRDDAMMMTAAEQDAQHHLSYLNTYLSDTVRPMRDCFPRIVDELMAHRPDKKTFIAWAESIPASDYRMIFGETSLDAAFADFNHALSAGAQGVKQLASNTLQHTKNKANAEIQKTMQQIEQQEAEKAAATQIKYPAIGTAYRPYKPAEYPNLERYYQKPSADRWGKRVVQQSEPTEWTRR